MHCSKAFSNAEKYVQEFYAVQLANITSNIELQSNLGNCELNVDLGFAPRQNRLVIQRIFANMGYGTKLINMSLELSWA